MPKDIKSTNFIRANLRGKLSRAEIVFHPDTENTFATYQFILPDKYDVWVNARTGQIIHAGRCINRV